MSAPASATIIPPEPNLRPQDLVRRVQRYYRDISTARTNIGPQWETFAASLAQERFGLAVDGLV